MLPENEINTPYFWEKEFYIENKIPLWECKTHNTKELGIIYRAKDNKSYVCAKVTCLPAQFFEFDIYCDKNGCLYNIATQSGTLEDFFDMTKKIADDGIYDNPDILKKLGENVFVIKKLINIKKEKNNNIPMNANEARQKAFDVNHERKGNQYLDILSQISGAVDDGKYEITYYSVILPDVKKRLEEDGYVVGNVLSYKNETMTRISWY